MSEDETRVKRLYVAALDVLYARLGGHLTTTADGKAVLDKLRDVMSQDYPEWWKDS